MGKSGKKRQGGIKKVVSCATAAALALCMTPAAAFASDAMSTYYALPKASEVTNFQHTAAGNGGNYTYKYVTIGAEGAAYDKARNAEGGYGTNNRVAPMAQTYYEVLGLNYVNAYRGVDTIFTWNNTQVEGKEVDDKDFSKIETAYTSGAQGNLQTRNASLSILGTTNNEVPDEYIWNYCCWANGATVSDMDMAMDSGNEGLALLSVTVDGTTYTNYPREIYWETDIINAADSSGTVGAGENNALLPWAEWVKIEQKRPGGSSTYNPVYTKFSAQHGGASKMVKGLHTLAETVDAVVAKSADSNGNYTLQTRYGGNTANGTSSMINAYEDIVQAPEYYALSKIADGTVKKRVTATLVGYDPKTGNYACRKYSVNSGTASTSDPDINLYGGRIANYLAPISTSIADLGLPSAQNTYGDKASTEAMYVQWLTPEQIAENCDAAFVCDAYSQNKISDYLATATDGEVHTVYYIGIGAEESKTEDNTAKLESARATLRNAGKDACDFCYSYPCTMFGNFYAQGVENGMISLVTCAYTYPEIFTGGIADLFAYWAKNVWHITDSALASVVTGATSGMHLSSGEEIGSVSANWQSNAEKIINAGNAYYLKNASTIDAMNGGSLKTYDIESLKARTFDGAVTELNNEITTLQNNVAEQTKTIASLTDQLNAAKAANSTVTINKATVKASDIPAAATTVILGTKVTTIKANAFKGSKVTTVFTMSKKLKKAKVKNCFKGSKVKTVQVPGSKYSAYKKIFTKANCGKKVTVS